MVSYCPLSTGPIADPNPMAERVPERGVTAMLAQVIWQSALLVGAGLIGFLLYPCLFLRPTGVHRKRATTASQGSAPVRARSAASAREKRPRQVQRTRGAVARR